MMEHLRPWCSIAIPHENVRKGLLEEAESVAGELEEMRLGKAAELVREGARETLACYTFPSEHGR